MSAHTSETPPLARRLREGSHSSKYDSELSRTLSEAATFPEVRRWIGVTPRLSLVGIKAPALHVSLEMSL